MPPIKKRTLTPDEALARLETLCVRAEHCTHELRQKLKLWAIDTADADTIITSLSERKFVDDSRYARALVGDKVRFARWGRFKILAALTAKHIDRAIITAALADIDTDLYEENLSHLLRAKARTMSPDEPHTYEGRTKLYRHALSRGYEPQLAARLVRSLYGD